MSLFVTYIKSFINQKSFTTFELRITPASTTPTIMHICMAGLDLDFKGTPFGPMPALCAIADEVTKVHAICVHCGALAYVSHRTVDEDKRVLLGEQTVYEPLCRTCYQQALAKDRANKNNKT